MQINNHVNICTIEKCLRLVFHDSSLNTVTFRRPRREVTLAASFTWRGAILLPTNAIMRPRRAFVKNNAMTALPAL